MFESGTEMGSPATIVYILLLVAVVVAVDFLLFKNQFWKRLTMNIGIVLVFAAPSTSDFETGMST